MPQQEWPVYTALEELLKTQDFVSLAQLANACNMPPKQLGESLLKLEGQSVNSSALQWKGKISLGEALPNISYDDIIVVPSAMQTLAAVYLPNNTLSNPQPGGR